MKLLRCAPALLAILLAACTVTVTSPVLEKLGAGISISGGAPATSPAATVPPVVTPAVPAVPAVDPTVSYWDSGTVSGAPYVVSAAGARWKFDPASKCSIGAGVAINGIDITNWCATVIKLGGDGFVYPFTTDGYWRRLRDMDAAGSGSVVGPPPPLNSVAPAAGGGTVAAGGPSPNAIPPGTSGRVTLVSPGGLKAAIAAASPGDTIKASPGIYAESAAIGVPLLIDGGGTITNPGDATATWNNDGAELAGETVANLAQGQGGFVPLIDADIRGWNIHGFGLSAQAADGTAGIRNNGNGVFSAANDYLHDNEMGIGPHAGGAATWHLKNILAVNNGLVANSGYAHNFYLLPNEVFIDGGVTSYVEPNKGGGHALKSRAPKMTIVGKNYFWASESSSVDIPDGSAAPVVIAADATGGTTIEKKAGDANHVLESYAVESTRNGVAGIQHVGATIRVPDDGTQWLFVTSGPISFDATSKFVNSNDNTPLRHGVIAVQGGGIVTGLP